MEKLKDQKDQNWTKQNQTDKNTPVGEKSNDTNTLTQEYKKSVEKDKTTFNDQNKFENTPGSGNQNSINSQKNDQGKTGSWKNEDADADKSEKTNQTQTESTDANYPKKQPTTNGSEGTVSNKKEEKTSV
jgi:hypothetical protein